VAWEDDYGHVIDFRHRIEFAGLLISTELPHHWPDDLSCNDVLRKGDLGLGEPGIYRRLYTTVGTEVADITGRLGVFLASSSRRPPFELALTGQGSGVFRDRPVVS